LVRYQLALLDWQTQPSVANTLLAPLHAQQLGSAESLWLGVRVARALNNPLDMQQLGQQLLQRYPESVQAQAWIQRKFEDQ
jgi:type IV pilus assembly protein PilF